MPAGQEIALPNDKEPEGSGERARPRGGARRLLDRAGRFSCAGRRRVRSTPERAQRLGGETPTRELLQVSPVFELRLHGEALLVVAPGPENSCCLPRSRISRRPEHLGEPSHVARAGILRDRLHRSLEEESFGSDRKAAGARAFGEARRRGHGIGGRVEA